MQTVKSTDRVRRLGYATEEDKQKLRDRYDEAKELIEFMRLIKPSFFDEKPSFSLKKT